MRYETLEQFWERVRWEGREAAAREHQGAWKAEGKRYSAIASLLIQQFQPLDGEETKLCPPHLQKKAVQPSGVTGVTPDAVKGAEGENGPDGEDDITPGRIDWKAEIEWAYQHLDQPSPQDPPSPGATALHAWARDNTSEFFRTFVTRLLPARSKEDVDARDEDDGRVLQLIDRVLGKLGVKNAEPGNGQPIAADVAVVPAALPGEGADQPGAGDSRPDGAERSP